MGSIINFSIHNIGLQIFMISHLGVCIGEESIAHMVQVVD